MWRNKKCYPAVDPFSRKALDQYKPILLHRLHSFVECLYLVTDVVQTWPICSQGFGYWQFRVTILKKFDFDPPHFKNADFQLDIWNLRDFFNLNSKTSGIRIQCRLEISNDNPDVIDFLKKQGGLLSSHYPLRIKLGR